MRLEIRLQPLKPLDLPFHYNAHLRGFIYDYFEPAIAAKLHEHGYSIRGRNYKLFTFSRISGKNSVYNSEEKKQKRIRFEGRINIQFSSIDAEDIAQEKDAQKSKADALLGFARRLLDSREPVIINDIDCEVVSVNIMRTPVIDSSGPIRINMLSPITVHRTYSFTDGQKATHFYHPFEELWATKLKNNLLNKAEAIGWQRDKLDIDPDFIKPYNVTKNRQTTIIDMGFIIKAWYGEYELNLPESLFWLAYKVGLGARNSAGFGMFDIVSSKIK